MKADSFKN